MRRIPLAIVFALIFLALRAPAQEQDTTYSFILSGGGGLTKNVSVFATLPGGLNQMGFSGTVRLMWKPEYLIRVGLETGLTHIYSVTIPSGGTEDPTFGGASAVMTAVPFMITISMPLWEDFELYGAGGIYVVNSHLDFAGQTQTQSVISMGNMVSLAYSRPISENMRLGTEVKYLYMDKFQDNNFTLQFMLYYTLSRY